MRSDTKKMVFLVFPRKKMVLDRKTIFLDGFGQENQGRKTNFFLGKTKKNKKNIFWETMRPDSKKMVFFWFSLGKSWFFCPKPSFS